MSIARGISEGGHGGTEAAGVLPHLEDVVRDDARGVAVESGGLLTCTASPGQEHAR